MNIYTAYRKFIKKANDKSINNKNYENPFTFDIF